MKKIIAVSVNRSDFGRMLPVYRLLSEREDVDFKLFATGSHLSKEYGFSIQEVREANLPGQEMLVDVGEPLLADAQILSQIGLSLRSHEPGAMLVLGDRHEILACAHAATLADVPVIHVGGGFVTEGTMEDRVRHAISKLAHIHLVANERCANRLMKMGEHPERIHCVGAPDLDMVRLTEPMSLEELLTPLKLSVEDPFLLVTVHPETKMTDADSRAAMKELFYALSRRPEQIIITGPGMEYGADVVFQEIENLVQRRDAVAFVKSLGAKRYVNAMKHAAAIVGNSSSGIIESSFFPIPTVNVGDRQRGRLSGKHVVDCAWNAGEIDLAIEMALSKEFRKQASEQKSHYGDGHSAEKIADICVQHAGRIALNKPFFTLD